MYTPAAFRETRTEVLLAAIRDAQLATLVTPADGELHITHVPMIPVADGAGGLTLEGHLARGNPHHRALAARELRIARAPIVDWKVRL